MKQLESIGKLINRFTKLPAVGVKTAQRYAYAVIDMSEEEVRGFCEALCEVKQRVRFCSVCGNFSENDTCDICARRNPSVICVVAYPKDILAFERAGVFEGVYHVLGGTLSPIDGRGPNELRIQPLVKRLTDNVKEVILATNPDVEGEATAMYLSRLIKPLNIKVTRIAQGISMGSDIEYADEATLMQAMEGRREL